MDTLLTNEKKVFTVSEISRLVKAQLEEQFPDIWVEGEVSNCTYHSSGHIYFSLKDESAQVKCALFRGNFMQLKFKIENGLKIIVRARVSVYMVRGDYQLIVSMVEPAGYGALQLAFEQLKLRLEKEGLFKSELKKPIPMLPQKIGIITSPTGAAIKDILSVINRRYSNVHILLYPVRVQGEGAAEEIAGAIRYVNAVYADLDILIVGRGGGSLEDLWAFNEEITARAIFNSNIPVISCVGHEKDFTIADFAADVRAPTPSAAAELVVKNKAELKQNIISFSKRLKSIINFLLQSYQDKLRVLVGSKAFRHPLDILKEHLQMHDEVHASLIRAMTQYAEAAEKRLMHVFEKLNILSPLASLGRGYSIVWKMPEHKILKNAADIHEHDQLKIRLHQGEAEFTVTHKKED
ncbi:MAG: exodeoxyribonuclease VII large subunit [bacterium]